MELKITGKNIELTDEVRRHIEHKLDKLARHLPGIEETRMEITKEKTKSRQHRFVAQVTVNARGTLLRGEERGTNLLTAIDCVAEVMDRQIGHYKGKLYSKGRGNSLSRGSFSQEAVLKPVRNRVIKMKRFILEPMLADEAIEQMELLGHDFFLFLNPDGQELRLLYRLRDGNYGLIEPELNKE
ncbi:MAG: ribosome-associated translation inhibitor RaiA [Dehalococcoidales bacterium]